MSREELQRAIDDFESFKSDSYSHRSLPSSWNIELALAALRSELDRVDPQPLSLEQLRERANKPYWHKSLTGRESKWGILPDHIAARPEDYHYGERWLAYDNQPKEEHDD